MKLCKRNEFLLLVVSLSIFFESDSISLESSNSTNLRNATDQSVEDKNGDGHNTDDQPKDITGTSERKIGLPELRIPQGVIQGMEFVTYHHRSISGFLGIPYAQPPTGNLRFKSPVPADAWKGTLDASSDQKVCPQLSGNKVIGEEDCLYLNVYTPQIITGNSSTPLPVMVYIHGEMFETGSGSSFRYSAEYLLDEEVVLVVFNYRLGALGFLSTGDKVAPGNYGLKDMALVLKWVQDNIAHFGGDPDQVTIFGQSAGACSADLLALSSMTNGLFHRYITESGSAFSNVCFRLRKTYAERATQLGDHLGCPTNSSTNLVDCLRKLNASEIVNTKSLFHVWETFPKFVWSPTDEPDLDEAFLTESPTDLYAAGKIHDLPWIAGVVRDEGFIISSYFYANPDKFEQLLTKFDDVLPYVLDYHNIVNDSAAVTKSLKEYYFNDLSVDRNVLLFNLTKLCSDAWFKYPVYRGMDKRLAYAKSVEYLYSFEYRGTYSMSPKFSDGSTDNYGVVHGDELFYLFPHPELGFEEIGKNRSKSDYEMVDTMVQLWTSFAANGSPRISNTEGTGYWTPHSREDNYLLIGNGTRVVTELHYFFLADEMNFWKLLTDPNTAPPESPSFLENLIIWLKWILSKICDIFFWIY